VTKYNKVDIMDSSMLKEIVWLNG